MTYIDEKTFEDDVIALLQRKGWSSEVLEYKTEEELIENWAYILFQNNKIASRLNNCPLTVGEKQQLLEKIKELRTPYNLNNFINGKTILLKRDNPDDKLNFGKEVSLLIYDRDQIAGGKSVYQIARQTIFKSKKNLVGDKRGDLTLLINGMPVIHIELKRSSVPVSQAIYQIIKYSNDKVFTGFFSLVQIFVAMTPEETRYFANPGDAPFNDKYFFQWADFNNEPFKKWSDVIEHLLSIPMAHKLIGFYTIPDDSTETLKVLRSYQYYAVEAIFNRVKKAEWNSKDKLGGYIWHTTGSGKTLTSFKAAQLLSKSGIVDKTVFLVDRIELGIQSAREYKNFAGDDIEVQETKTTGELVARLKSDNASDSLIVTSIQKMSNVNEKDGTNSKDIFKICGKKIAFIIDECHRSTFGDMLITIKNTFPNAIYFGFTGTPIHDENQKYFNTTTDVFGDELHRYSIYDGIRDGNVLGFDHYKICTFEDIKLREQVGLHQAKAKTLDEVWKDEKKKEIFLHYLNDVPMGEEEDELGNRILGIESYFDNEQYALKEEKEIYKQHKYKVVEYILEKWNISSLNGKFSSLFATSSIKEACEYYRLFKQMMGKNGLPTLKITAVFDESIDNNEGFAIKEDALIEILEDYNSNFNQNFDIPKFQKFKKDVASRFAHKDGYLNIEKRDPSQVLNLVIVVDQMLTGYDSKWINTLYLDKILKYEAIVQAFSRTNRIFGNDKPYGTIKYFRKPHTMENNIKRAFMLYSGNKPMGIFVDKLEENIQNINFYYQKIKFLFESEGISNFMVLPFNAESKRLFAKLYALLCKLIKAAQIQGFNWDKKIYKFKKDQEENEIEVLIDEYTFMVLNQRYKELFVSNLKHISDNNYFEIDSIALEIDSGKIDDEYINNNFEKYRKEIQSNGPNSDKAIEILNELHKSFALLSVEDQSIAQTIITDFQNGNLFIFGDKTLKDYINEYKLKKENDLINQFAHDIGVDSNQLRALIVMRPNSSNLNEYGRFDEFLKSMDEEVAFDYISKLEKHEMSKAMARIKIKNLIREFILNNKK